MDTNAKKAAAHSAWVKKELELRPGIQALMPMLKKEGFHSIHRALGILFEHLGEYGDMKKDLTAMKHANKHGYKFKGNELTDAEVETQARLSKQKQAKINNIVTSLTSHYQDAMSFPLPFKGDVNDALNVLQTYLRHLSKKFTGAVEVSHKAMAKRGQYGPFDQSRTCNFGYKVSCAA